MNPFIRHARACSLVAMAAFAGASWAQDGDAAAGADSPSAGGIPTGALPGLAVQRDIYVPVDGQGHVSSNQYIVVERRVLTPGKQGGDAAAEGSKPEAGASPAATPEVPTRFILVPQEDDAGAGNGSSGDGSGAR